MNVDLEASGALVTAGLAASAIEGGGSARHGGEHALLCANCAAPLNGDPYCGSCGQKTHLHRSVLHLGEEFLHGILHFDTKAWRTLPLLALRPGELTRRYLRGERTRFVSPLALFLFMMFFMFFVASMTNGRGYGPADSMKEGQAGLARKLEKTKAKVLKSEAELKAASTQEERAEAASALVEERARVAEMERGVKSLENAALLATQAEGDWQQNKIDLAPGKGNVANTGVPQIDEALAKAARNPDLTMYKLKSAASKFTFLLVPFSMPFLWLMFFWRRSVTMYDHAVFVLYSLSFMAALMSLFFLLKYAGLSWSVAGFLFLVPPLHMCSQLRGTYGLGWGGTLWRGLFLMCAAVTVFALYLALILVLTVK